MPGLFITFEGGEGVGKTTQIQRLADNLKHAGHEPVLTREPGGTPGAEAIRDLLSHPEWGEKWTPEAETMLLFAARAMHIKDIIEPALKAGKIILCDRYIDSTRVYQGYIQKLDKAFLQSLEERIVKNFVPDLTFILDLTAEEALKRVENRGAVDHYDRRDKDFYTQLHQGFKEIAEQNPQRCLLIDAAQDEEKIAQQVADIVLKRLN
jgi:dTMP kinase